MTRLLLMYPSTLQDLSDKNSPAYNPEVFTEELNNSATVDDGGNVVADESWADWLLGGVPRWGYLHSES